MGADEGDCGGEWDHALARVDLGAWPHVPRHAHAVEALGIWARHLRHRGRVIDDDSGLLKEGEEWRAWSRGVCV